MLGQNLHIWNGTKMKNFNGVFCMFLGIETPIGMGIETKMIQNLKVRDCIMQNFMELDMRKTLNLKAVKSGVGV